MNGKKSGQGTLYLKYDEEPENATKVYEGLWGNDKFNGVGVFYHENGKHKKHEGTFKNDELADGQVKQYTEAGRLIYDGEIKKEQFDGYGIKYDEKSGSKTY